MNPPPTFLQKTHTHTHKQESWLLYPYKPQRERAKIHQRRGLSTSLWLHTRAHTCTCICTHQDAQHSQRSRKTTWAQFHIDVSTQPQALRRWEKWKWGENGTRGRGEKKRWECEGKQVTQSEKELDSRAVMALKWGCFVSSASLLSRGKSNPPICPPNTLTDPSLILPSVRGKHPGHRLLLCTCVCLLSDALAHIQQGIRLCLLLQLGLVPWLSL